VNISGGEMSDLYTYATSTVNVSGGSATSLDTHDTSTVNVSGGSATSLEARDTSSVDVSGGSVSGLYTYGASIAVVSGGAVTDLRVYDTSIVALYGKEFVLGGGLSLDGNDVLGTGVLSGKWLDGTSWATTISMHDLTAAIWLVSEPNTGPQITGDANGDGVVDAADYVLVKRNFGMTDAEWWDGDFSRNGTVDWADLQLLMGNFGTNSGNGAVPAPEPGSLMLLMFAAAALFHRRQVADAP